MRDISSIQYCSNCGQPMAEDYAFCPECGTKAASDNGRQPFMRVEPAPAGGTAPAPARPPRKPLSRAAKLSIASGIVVVALGVGAYYLGQYMTDEQRLLSKFEKSAKDGDADQLYELLASSNEDTRFDLNKVKVMAEYLADNEDIVEELMEELRSEAERLKAGDVESFVNDEDTPFVYLEKKDKKKWLLYDEYELKLRRYMIPVYANLEGTAIFVNNERVAVLDDNDSRIEVGPLLPGNYEVRAVYESEYATLESTETIGLFPMWEYDNRLEFNLYGDYIYVHANDEAASVYINGKDVGLLADGNQAIGPISYDGSNKIYVQAEYPWGTVKSEEQEVSSEVMQFTIDPLTEELKESIMSSAHRSVSTWVQALQAKDASLARGMSDDLLDQLSGMVSSYEESGLQFVGSVASVTFDLDSFQFYANDNGSYETRVKARMESNEAVVSADEVNVETAPVTYDAQFVLEYQNGEWILSAFYDSYDDISMEHTRTYE